MSDQSSEMHECRASVELDSMPPIRYCDCGKVMSMTDQDKRDYFDYDQHVDLGDYPPMPRNYEQCETCDGDLTFRHHCDLMQAFRQILDETCWVEKRQLKAHRASILRIRAIAAAMLGEDGN